MRVRVVGVAVGVRVDLDHAVEILHGARRRGAVEECDVPPLGQRSPSGRTMRLGVVTVDSPSKHEPMAVPVSSISKPVDVWVREMLKLSKSTG